MRILKELLPQVKGEGRSPRSQEPNNVLKVLTREEWQVLVWAYLNRRDIDKRVRIYYKGFGEEVLDRTFRDGRRLGSEDFKRILSNVETKTCAGGYYTVMHWVQDIYNKKGEEVGAIYEFEDDKVPNEVAKQHPYITLNDKILVRLMTEGKEPDKSDRDAFVSPPGSWKDVTYLYAVILRSLRQMSYGPKSTRKRCGVNVFTADSFKDALGYSKSTFARRCNELKEKRLLTIKTRMGNGAMTFIDTVDPQVAKKVMGVMQWMFYLSGSDDDEQEAQEARALDASLPNEVDDSMGVVGQDDFSDVPGFTMQPVTMPLGTSAYSPASPFSLEDIDI